MKPKITGIILLMIAIISFIQLIFAKVPHVILAFCYIGILIAAIGFLTNRSHLVYSYVTVALIAQIPFSIDLIRAYLGLEQIIGLVTYDPSYFTFVGKIVDLSVHLVTLPIALFALPKIPIPKYDVYVKNHVLLASGIFIISLLFKTNCVKVGCFEPLAYGLTLTGHIIYLTTVAIICPLILGYYLRKIHIFLNNKKLQVKNQ